MSARGEKVIAIPWGISNPKKKKKKRLMLAVLNRLCLRIDSLRLKANLAFDGIQQYAGY